MKSLLKKPLLAATALSALLGITATSNAQTQVYSEDFEVNHQLDSTWVTNSVGGSNVANLYFDYSTVGIPAAPHSGGTTHGLKLQANLSTAVQAFPSGVTVSPNGFSITENFEMRFDSWLNYNGPLNGGGNGSTQIGGAGFGTAGIAAQTAGGSFDSVVVGYSGDGSGTSADYRVYSPSHGGSYQDADHVLTGDLTSPLVYFAGTRNNSASTYYTTNFLATTAPAAQTSLFPLQTGSTQAGSQAFKWHDVSLKKVGNRITYSIDGHLIATADARDVGTLGGFNILFTHFDINPGASTDPNAAALAFSLFDNIRITNFPTIVTVEATTPTASETGPTPGVFTLTRTSSGTPLTVSYAMSGTATSGADYTTLSGSVTFAATETTTNITVTPIDDSISELPETVILTVNDGVGYVSDGNATVTISDNDTPTIDLSAVQTTMYERLTNDYAKFRLTRRGDLSAVNFDVNIAYSGNAVGDVDYSPVGTVTMEQNVATKTFSIHPIDNGVLDNPRTVTVALAAGTGYAIGTNTPVNATIVDDELPAETVIWSDNLQTDTSANWKLLFGSTNSDFLDFTATWAFDYSGNYGIPPAPHSGTDTHGLLLTVNKSGGGGAGLNAYPIGQSFSGDYALRFDMYVIEGATATTEHTLFGINHSGTKTNWFRNGGVPAGWAFDGLFYYVESDGAAQLTGDYALNSSPNAGNNPTILTSVNASTMINTFKSPPWTSGLIGGGVPANLLSTTTPCWADVEIRQVGNVVSLIIDKALVFAYTNTTAFTNGNIMLGYNDAFDSTGASEASVIFANVRVVSLATATPPNITAIQVIGGNVQIDFSGSPADTVGQFTLQSASTVTGSYADVSSVITPLGAGHFRATKAVSGGMQFYRIKRL
jgi:Calx-beta domain